MSSFNAQMIQSESPRSHLELSEAFRDCDGDGDGRIDFVEFASLVSMLRARPSHASVLNGFSQIDRNNDGYIEFQEFLSWWRTAAAH